MERPGRATSALKVGIVVVFSLAMAQAAGCGVVDPENSVVSVAITNDLAHTVTIHQCGDSCKPSGIAETDSIGAGQTFDTYVQLNVLSPWLVSNGSRGMAGCLPILVKHRDPKPSPFRVSAATPAADC